MNICYKYKKFNADHRDIINHVQKIIDRYQQMGIEITLRTLHYRLVAANRISNTLQEYQKVAKIVADARLAGELSWESIVDRARNLEEVAQWHNAQQFIRSVIPQFNMNKWRYQDNYVEVWVEKDAQFGVLSGPCTEYEVPLLACRGYLSWSELWSASQRMGMRIGRQDKKCTILHFGDHDPAGVDMTRDLESRMKMLIRHDLEVGTHTDGETSDDQLDKAADLDEHFTVKRVALNMDQILHYNLAPNPVKMKDGKAKAYVSQFGHTCWEMDALDPQDLLDMVTDEILQLRDEDKWEEAVEKQEQEREKLSKVKI